MHNEIYKKKMNAAITKAKKKVENEFVGVRKWLEFHANPYQKDDSVLSHDEYRLSLYVWEGSPVKGYVIANWHNGGVMAFDCGDKKLLTIKVDKNTID